MAAPALEPVRGWHRPDGHPAGRLGRLLLPRGPGSHRAEPRTRRVTVSAQIAPGWEMDHKALQKWTVARGGGG